MRSALPIPSIQYFPKEFQGDLEGLALSAALDSALSGVQADILGMRDLRNPESCPSQLLDELAASIGIDLLRTDSEAIKRAKIVNGVRSQKYKGLWEQDAKNRIWNITGVEPVIYQANNASTWALCGDLSLLNSFAIFGTDGIDLNLGFDLEGYGTEVSFMGSVYIDIGAGIAADVVSRLVEELREDVCPAFFLITLGYGSGTSFTPYAGGIF
jgi:hypothetical protein